MREIKFRGYDPVSKEWVYGYYTKTSFGKGFSDSIVVFDGACTKPVKVDPDSVGQYTGKHDKNGYEVYEGDEVKVWNGNKTSIGHNGFCFTIGARGRMLNDYEISDLDVIGKVYQNNKLMESK